MCIVTRICGILWFKNWMKILYRIFLIRKSQNAPVPYPIMPHPVQKYAHFCHEWSIAGYGTGVFWDLGNWYTTKTLQWHHNSQDGVSNHLTYRCLLNRLFSADQRKQQSSASLAFVREIPRRPANSPHKWPVTRKFFPFDNVIMSCSPVKYNYEDLRYGRNGHNNGVCSLHSVKSWWAYWAMSCPLKSKYSHISQRTRLEYLYKTKVYMGKSTLHHLICH